MHAHECALFRQQVFTRLRPCSSASQALFRGGEGWTALRISQPPSRSARSTTIKILLPLEEGQESKFTAVHVSPLLRPHPLFFFFFSSSPSSSAQGRKADCVAFFCFVFCKQEALCELACPLTTFDSSLGVLRGAPKPCPPPFKMRRRTKTGDQLHSLSVVQAAGARQPPLPPRLHLTVCCFCDAVALILCIPVATCISPEMRRHNADWRKQPAVRDARGSPSCARPRLMMLTFFCFICLA